MYRLCILKVNTYKIVHRCGPDGSMRAVTQRARVRSPVGTSFLGEVFRGFSSPVRQMSGSLKPQGPRISFGRHYHHRSSFITGANDLRCWGALKAQICIHIKLLRYLLYCCENWSLILREEQRLRVFENEILRKIFGNKRNEITWKWRKLHNSGLVTLYAFFT